MVDIHYFIFILNADNIVVYGGAFALAFVALKLVYRMWRNSLSCPHCGIPYKAHENPPPPPITNQSPPLPNSLWT